MCIEKADLLIMYLSSKEERYCNGQMRAINCYQDGPELENKLQDILAQLN
jgi:hypothetical protein